MKVDSAPKEKEIFENGLEYGHNFWKSDDKKWEPFSWTGRALLWQVFVSTTNFAQ